MYKTMLYYCLKCRKNKKKNSKVPKTNKRKLIILSKFSVCDSKKSRYIKEEESSGLLSIKYLPLSKIPVLGDILF